MYEAFNLRVMRNAVEHVNDDHSDAMLLILKDHTKKQWMNKAVLESYAPKQMLVRGENEASDRSELFQIPFPKPLTNAKEFRPVLIAMLKQASDTKPEQ
ncbi:MAG: DUF2470 domain-containing protein [Bacteroidota bacterium]